MVVIGLPAVWFKLSISTTAEFPVVIEGNPTDLGLVVNIRINQTTLNQWPWSTQPISHSPILNSWYRLVKKRVFDGCSPCSDSCALSRPKNNDTCRNYTGYFSSRVFVWFVPVWQELESSSDVFDAP